MPGLISATLIYALLFVSTCNKKSGSGCNNQRKTRICNGVDGACIFGHYKTGIIICQQFNIAVEKKPAAEQG